MPDRKEEIRQEFFRNLKRRLEGNPNSSWSSVEGYWQLLKVHCFIFDRIGPMGEMSNEECAFRAVLKSTEAAALFKEVFSRGTDAGKLYALCGLRRTDFNTFETCAAALRENTNEVMLRAGCDVYYQPVGNIARQIANGSFDWHFK